MLRDPLVLLPSMVMLPSVNLPVLLPVGDPPFIPLGPEFGLGVGIEFASIAFTHAGSISS